MTALEPAAVLPPGPLIDPSGPAFVADPYPAHAHVREATAAWHPDGGELTFVTRFGDVHAPTERVP